MADNFMRIRNGVNVGMASADPANPQNGDTYYNTTTNKLREYKNGAWRNAVDEDSTQTLTNKTLTSPVINTPTGITKSDVGLGNVDNTSDATKNSAAVTLTNKTIQFLQQAVATDSSTTGSNATLAAFTTGVLRLTNSSLVSISGIPAGVAGQQLVLENKTGSTLTVNNDDAGATAANRIFTGTGAPVSMPDNSTFTFTYDSTSSRWMLTGGTGSGSGTGGINYIKFGDAEAGTQGWATYKDAAGSLPVDGTGGSPTLTLTAGASNPLRGTKSYFINKSASNQQGEGVSYDFTIDAADKGKVLQISFDYLVYAATYTDADIGVYIYDVTNAQVIQPAGFSIQNALISVSQKCTFQTSNNSTSYRLIFHVTSTTTNSFTVQFDNVIVGPQIVTNGAADTNAESFTPIWNADNITNTGSTSGNFHREGGELVVDFHALYGGGGTAAGVTIMKLPGNLTIDTTRTSPQADQTFGAAQFFNGASVRYPAVVSFYDSQHVFFIVPTAVGTAGYLDSSTVSSGSAFGGTFRVPIVGWSSNVQLSSDTDTRVITANATSPSTTTTANTNTGVVFTSIVSDTHGTFNTSTGVYTVTSPGYYNISAYVGANAASWTAGNRLIAYYRVNSTDNEFGRNTISATGSQIVQISASALGVPLKAGDTVQLRLLGEVAVTLFGGFISIARQSGPSVIAATETMACTYTGNAGQALSGTAIIVKYPNKVFDTHGIYDPSTGIITIPAPGIYLIKASVWCGTQATTTGQHMGAYINTGSVAGSGVAQDYAYMIPGQSGDYVPVFKMIAVVKNIAGTTYTVQADSDIGASRSLNTSDGIMTLSVERIG